jgi:hypothetical protein
MLPLFDMIGKKPRTGRARRRLTGPRAQRFDLPWAIPAGSWSLVVCR